MPLIETYMGILYLRFPFLMLGIIGSGAARATGITKETEIIFAIAGVVNLILDYPLIFGIGPFPELGLAGAAWATAMSFVFLFSGIIIILRRCGLLGFGPMPGALAGLRDIPRFFVPTVSMQVMVPLTSLFITYLLAEYGSEAVAAYGVASRIETLALTGVFAISIAITPFVAQNFGAGEFDRIDDTIIFAGRVSLCLGGILFALLALLGPTIARIFSDDSDVIDLVSLYFKIVAISYVFQSIVNVTVAILNGLQMPSAALRLMAIRTFAIVFPLLLISAQLGLWWILGALTIGNVIAAIYATRVMRKVERKYNRPIADTNRVAAIVKDIRKLMRPH